MENKDNNITKLSDDIRKIFVSKFGEGVEMTRLCRDHHDPFLYRDKMPVLSLSQDEFVGIFDTGTNHFFLSPDQIFRFGVYCRLTLPGIIALMMKAEWERFIMEASNRKSSPGLNLTVISDDPDLIGLYLPDFRPDKHIYFEQIKNNSNGKKDKRSYGQIDYFISDLLERRNFLVDNEQVAHLYPDTEITEEMFLRKISVLQKEEYLSAKELWRLKSTSLDDMLLSLERKKKVNMGKEDQYFREFGELESEKAFCSNRLKYYVLILEIMRDEPELSYRELIKSARERLAESEIERMELESKIKRSRNYIETIEYNGTASMASYEFAQAYIRECKALLHEIHKLLHTDTCKNYSNSFDEKQKEVNELWLELMKSTKNEIFSYSPSMLLYSYPDYQQLLSIYQRACEILGRNPEYEFIGNRLEYMIRNGASPDAVLEFLYNETKQIEIQLAHLELIQDEYTGEGQARIYNQALQNVDSHSERLRSEIAGIKKNIKMTKKEISVQHTKVVKYNGE